MICIDKIAHFRDDGRGCLGTYRAIRIAFWRIYISIGWRIEKP